MIDWILIICILIGLGVLGLYFLVWKKPAFHDHTTASYDARIARETIALEEANEALIKAKKTTQKGKRGRPPGKKGPKKKSSV